MVQLMRMERKKLFQSKIFWIVLAIGMILVLWDIVDLAIETGQEMEMYEEWYNPELPASTLYNVWLGNEGYSFAFSVFLLPVSAALCASIWVVTELGYEEWIFKEYCSADKQKEIFSVKVSDRFFRRCTCWDHTVGSRFYRECDVYPGIEAGYHLSLLHNDGSGFFIGSVLCPSTVV